MRGDNMTYYANLVEAGWTKEEMLKLTDKDLYVLDHAICDESSRWLEDHEKLDYIEKELGFGYSRKDFETFMGY